MDLDHLKKGHQRFYKKYFIEAPDLYKKLVREGQAPKTLVVSCSDSRADPAIFLDTKPGDLFVIRNVASLVPPYQPDKMTYHGTSAALEFGVKQLQVESIVVIGHSYCAGIQSLLDVPCKQSTEYIEDWVNIAYKAKEAKETQENMAHGPHALACCIRESVRISLENLLTFPWIESRVASGDLGLLGWYFNMDTGNLEEVQRYSPL